jgi:hypothetical protein
MKKREKDRGGRREKGRERKKKEEKKKKKRKSFINLNLSVNVHGCNPEGRQLITK